MSLSEGKMFTIEALNRIEGFVWPEGAKFAAFDIDDTYLNFFGEGELYRDGVSFVGKRLINASVNIGKARIDWCNSLITREEFESVDGWVRNDGKPRGGSSAVDVMLESGGVSSDVFAGDYDWSDDDIKRWRYHKPQKQEAKPEPESIETMILRHKDAKENKRVAIDKLNQAQADVEQAEALEDSLFMAIEAWAERHGFDIRVLSESEKK